MSNYDNMRTRQKLELPLIVSNFRDVWNWKVMGDKNLLKVVHVCVQYMYGYIPSFFLSANVNTPLGRSLQLS